jgi:hypothetical protein
MAKLWVTSVTTGVKSRRLHMYLLKQKTCRAIVYNPPQVMDSIISWGYSIVVENTCSIHATALIK